MAVIARRRDPAGGRSHYLRLLSSEGQKYEYGPGTRYCKVNIWAFVGLFVGAAVGFAVHWGIASINSLVVSIIVYYVLMKMFGKTNSGIIGESIED